MSSGRASNGSALRRMVATGTLAVAIIAVGAVGTVGASAGAGAEVSIPAISGAQLACLGDQHLDTSSLAGTITTEAIAALVAAANICGITIPPTLLAELQSRVGTAPAADPRVVCL